MMMKTKYISLLIAATTLLAGCAGQGPTGLRCEYQDGNVLESLGFFDYYTVASDRDHRCIGNIALEATIDGDTFRMVGFENHGGQTQNVATPLGKVLSGHGNMYRSSHEGFLNDQVLATYMHGPLLPKNPMAADKILQRALRRNYGSVTLEKLDDTLELKAQEVMLKRLKVI